MTLMSYCAECLIFISMPSVTAFILSVEFLYAVVLNAVAPKTMT